MLSLLKPQCLDSGLYSLGVTMLRTHTTANKCIAFIHVILHSFHSCQPPSFGRPEFIHKIFILLGYSFLTAIMWEPSSTAIKHQAWPWHTDALCVDQCLCDLGHSHWRRKLEDEWRWQTVHSSPLSELTGKQRHYYVSRHTDPAFLCKSCWGNSFGSGSK